MSDIRDRQLPQDNPKASSALEQRRKRFHITWRILIGRALRVSLRSHAVMYLSAHLLSLAVAWLCCAYAYSISHWTDRWVRISNRADLGGLEFQSVGFRFYIIDSRVAQEANGGTFAPSWLGQLGVIQSYHSGAGLPMIAYRQYVTHDLTCPPKPDPPTMRVPTGRGTAWEALEDEADKAFG